jgi:Domain of unknown function (DUF4234)
MARELRIRNSDALVKIRNPWAVALLPFITLGIYHLVWSYPINRELRDFGYANDVDLGTSPVLSTLALFPGGLIIVPALVTYWRGTMRVQEAGRVGGTEPINGLIVLLLYIIIAPSFWAYIQVSLNAVWTSNAVYLSMPRAAAVQAAVTSRMNLAWVVASEEIHSISLLPGPRSSEPAIAFSAFS